MFSSIECVEYIKLLMEHMGEEAYLAASAPLERAGGSARERVWHMLDIVTTP